MPVAGDDLGYTGFVAVGKPDVPVRLPAGVVPKAPQKVPKFKLGRGLKKCANCQTRNTLWLIGYGEAFNRRCWHCMTPEERQALRNFIASSPQT